MLGPLQLNTGGLSTTLQASKARAGVRPGPRLLSAVSPLVWPLAEEGNEKCLVEISKGLDASTRCQNPPPAPFDWPVVLSVYGLYLIAEKFTCVSLWLMFAQGCHCCK